LVGALVKSSLTSPITLPLTAAGNIFIAMWLYGIASAMDRIEINMVKAENRTGLENLPSYLDSITQSWMIYWAFVLGVGLFSGALMLYIGGWWYRVRLGWSGHKDADKGLARAVYVFASLVWALPMVLVVLADTLTYSNFIEYYNADAPWQTVMIVFPFWAVVASYKGATARFQLKKIPGMIWFLILPIIIYIVVMGTLITLLLRPLLE